MGQDGPDEGLNVFGRNVVSALQDRLRLGRTKERQSAPRADPELEIFVVSRGAHDLEEIAPDLSLDPDRAHDLLQVSDHRGVAVVDFLLFTQAYQTDHAQYDLNGDSELNIDEFADLLKDTLFSSI